MSALHRLALTLLAAASLARCGGTTPAGDAAPMDARPTGDAPASDAALDVPMGGGEIPTGAPVSQVDTGASAPVMAGGYAVTANAGGTWRVAWQGSGAGQRFSGSVWTTGRFDSVQPGCQGACPLGTGEVLGRATVTGGERVDFDSRSAGDVRGFDVVTPQAPVYLLLRIDGAADPARVLFTSMGAAVSAPALPFGLTP